MLKILRLPSVRTWWVGLGLALGGALSLGITSCHKDDSSPTPALAANVKLATSATLGPMLTDSVGNSLYAFALDADGVNTCTSAACNPMWPVYFGGTVRVPAGMNATDFSTKKTADGRSQTFYKGWPLYYYAPLVSGVNTREAAGLTGGNGIGGVWFVVNPSYGVTLARKSVLDQTTKTATTKSYLVDDQGRTLYYFAKDDAQPTTQPTNCTGGCATAWPALYQSAPATPSALKASDFGSITRAASTTTGPYGTTTSSTQQLTYKGHPLYYFAGDNATRGQVTGDHLSSFGDFWYVAVP
ncbi:MAG: COG4315 family predicted lipoprotein [Janthinobacterium lividum]